MLLSVAEKRFIYEGLLQSPPARPDLRNAIQYREINVSTDVLKSSNGSAWINMKDGSECVSSCSVAIKKSEEAHFNVECEVSIFGLKEENELAQKLKLYLELMYQKNTNRDMFKINNKHCYTIKVECVVLKYTNNPISIISFANYIALKRTRVPGFCDSVNFGDANNVPLISSDYFESRLLNEISETLSFDPPIMLVVGIIGNNIIFDPSADEEQVLENSMIVTYYEGEISAPIMSVNYFFNTVNTEIKEIPSSAVCKCIATCEKHGNEIVSKLNALLEDDLFDIEKMDHTDRIYD